MPQRALVICPMDLMVASLGDKPFFGHDPFHVLDDDDGVVHQKADDDDQGEHGQGVDGEAGGRQHPHGPQEHHRHRDGGDQCRPEVLQEEEHDDEDQEDRLHQGVYHLFDGDLHEGGGVVGIDHLHSRRKVLGEFRHLCLNPVCGLQGVGAGRQPDRHSTHRLPVVERLNVVVFGADLAFGHILEFYRGAVGIGAQDDVVELIGRLKQGAGGDGGVQLLPLDGRSAAELTGRYLDVLGLQRVDNVIRWSDGSYSVSPGQAISSWRSGCRTPSIRLPRPGG